MKTKYIKKKDNKNGVKGYKVFKSNWTCRDKQYICPGTFKEEDELKVCEHGMHFCKRAVDCFHYYTFHPNNHVAEVIAWGNVITEGNKSCTDELEIVREIPWDEVLLLVNIGENNIGYGNVGHDNTGKRNIGHCNSGNANTGDCNTGSYNIGDCNTGDGNAGICNTGNYNTGDSNIGCWNTGDKNTGKYNAGDENIGNHNAGHYNTGHYNTGCFNKSDYNTGCFNTTEETIRLFNKSSDWTYSDWLYSDAYNILSYMPSLQTPFWICTKEMSEKQKLEHSEYQVTKGCLINRKGCDRQKWWNDLSQEDKDTVLSLPNFDSKIFLECTGIDVTK